MIRRNFLQRITMAGTAGLAARGLTASDLHKASFRVQGFTCVTCAVGLDTLLRDRKGVVRSKSSYPDGMVTIDFDPRLVSEKELVAFVTEQGFKVVGKTAA